MSRPLVFYSPSETYGQALNRAADLFGIEREYWDIFGTHHTASAEGVAEVLRSMGIDAGSAEGLDCAVEGRWWEEWSRLIPPTLVASVQDPMVALRLPREVANRVIDLEVAWEDGSTESARLPLDSAEDGGSAKLRGREFAARRIRVPFRLRLGYHELRAWIDGGETVAARWILCPDRAY